jgi:hypothetical protein
MNQLLHSGGCLLNKTLLVRVVQEQLPLLRVMQEPLLLTVQQLLLTVRQRETPLQTVLMEVEYYELLIIALKNIKIFEEFISRLSSIIIKKIFFFFLLIFLMQIIEGNDLDPWWKFWIARKVSR